MDYFLSPATIIEFTGPGALDCLQGLVSNDIVKPGEPSLTYAGILTAKGLLVTDCWLMRAHGRLLLVAPLTSRSALTDVFRRTLPPRLARAVDRTDEWRLLLAWAWPAEGVAQSDDVIAGQRPAPTWFDRLVVGPAAAVKAVVGSAAAAGARQRDAAWAEERRILAGWPQVGREIDEKTLVQEVRFDENGGVSYDKGCYTGQETVARLHFRGHTNRSLRGLAWEGDGSAGDDRVLLDDREVGRVTSRLEMPGRRLGLALIRREVDDGARVVAAGAPATVVALPFQEAPRS